MIDTLRTHWPLLLLSIAAIVGMYLHVKKADAEREADGYDMPRQYTPPPPMKVRTVRPRPKRRLLDERLQDLHRQEVETRRAAREGNRDASRQPKGSGPRVDATNVHGLLRLNQ